MLSAAECNIGAIRIVNQDRIYASDGPVGRLPNLYIVADGMGGHAAGEVAAAEAVHYCIQFARDAWAQDPVRLFYEIAQEANRHVYQISCSNPEYAGMGTTLVAVTLFDDYVYCVNVGDSRMYVINHEDEFVRITTDHSLVEQMVIRGEITEAEARVHPKRNFITRAIGTSPNIAADVYKIPRDYIRKIVLCSDGLSGQVDDGRIHDIISIDGLPLRTRAQMLVNEANRNGGLDNVSVILIDPEGGDR